MSRKAPFAVNSALFTRRTTQRIARAGVQTTARSFAADPYGLLPAVGHVVGISHDQDALGFQHRWQGLPARMGQQRLIA